MFPPSGYEYLTPLASGQATTWIGRSLDKGNEVVIKTLELQRVDDWKGIELFEREVKTLQQLSHPSIPKFITFLTDEYEGAKRWHIVQEKIAGQTVEALLPKINKEKDLRRIAEQTLQTLVYLQHFSPPLLHRDLKPANMILDQGKLSIIDFGSVRHVVPSRVGGSTVAGTSGYMAPEQLMGRADSSSDLYALGMTLIHIITQTHPDDLPKKRMKVEWEEHAKITLADPIRKFINKLSEPHPENRYRRAEEALNAMNESPPPASLIPTTDSTRLTLKEIDSKTLLARGAGLSRANFGSSLAAASVTILGLILFLNLIILVPLFFVAIWFLITKTTNTLFHFENRKMQVTKGWLFKSVHEFNIAELLALEDKRRFKTAFEVDNTALTGPLSYRERVSLLQKLQSMGSTQYDAQVEESVLDFNHTKKNVVHSTPEQVHENRYTES